MIAVRKRGLYRKLIQSEVMYYQTFYRNVKLFLEEHGIKVSRSHYFSPKEVELLRGEW